MKTLFKAAMKTFAMFLVVWAVAFYWLVNTPPNDIDMGGLLFWEAVVFVGCTIFLAIADWLSNRKHNKNQYVEYKGEAK